MSPRGGHLKDEGSKLQVVTAGAIAGLVSRFVVAPLDVVKIRLQLQPYSLSDPLAPLREAPAYRGTVHTIKHILKHEGITGLWKGNVPAELMYVCYSAVQFTAYRSTTVFLQTALPGNRRLPDSAETFVAGAVSGAAATSATYPLDLLRTRFAAQGRQRVYSSLRGALRDIRRDEGVRGFFRGLAPALGQIVPFMGIFFASRYVYSDIPVYTSAVRALRAIYATEGLRGLYKGLPISLIKAAPASTVTLWTYERSLKLMMSWDENEGEASL
ncbi:mitochondrial carrier [Trichoderma longibrachiatum ATCC 18648]|uniref:Mitochondrial thiamine pyrophosphate carrier 1 n=1 Tax=Trichoderma longibrachiatum ATCC 18648 TaxID=983965 RepID=A0A2T4C3E2_TRILO|nr:mitochondrial carrier [Trichoderma longibrachiatum ATCC 18648]